MLPRGRAVWDSCVFGGAGGQHLILSVYLLPSPMACRGMAEDGALILP